LWLKEMPSSCGNVSRNCSASSACVVPDCSSSGSIRLP